MLRMGLEPRQLHTGLKEDCDAMTEAVREAGFAPQVKVVDYNWSDERTPEQMADYLARRYFDGEADPEEKRAAALFRVFNREPAVIALGLRIIGVTFPFYFIYSVLQILGDSLRGLGKARGPMLIILINLCLVRTALLFLIVPRVNEIRGVAVCYPITWALTAACMLLCYVQCIRKEKTIGSL